jgi:hypothetical protein
MTNTRYKYYLDGILFNNPIGWQDWKTKLIRDEGIGGIVTEEEGQVTFTGEAHQYIYAKRKEGYCSTITVVIWEDCSRSGNFKLGFEGKIFISDVEFSLTHCTAKCELIDNSYFSTIANNRQVECSINAGKTKNGEAIAPLSLYRIQMFNPCDGVDSNLPKPKAYRAFDIGDYILQFMSDGLIRLESSVLDIGGEFEGMFLTKSLLMTDPSNTDQGILFKWEEWIYNVRKIGALSWRIVSRPTGLVFLLEKTTDTFTNSVSLNFSTVNEIKRKIDSVRNYAAVELGTDNVIDSLGCGALGGGEPAFPDQINLIGCKREQFAVTGVCNINSILDLTTDWIISSNVIEEIYFNGDEGYSDKVILLDCTSLNPSTLTASAVKHDVFGNTLPVFYNATYFNRQIAERNLSGIPATLVKYLNAPETGFKAAHTGTEVITIPATVINSVEWVWLPYPFGDDFTGTNYDLNNDWGNGTTPGVLITQANSCYTSPFQNVYKFKFTTDLQLVMPNFLGTILRVTWKRYDSGLTLLADYPAEVIIPTNGPTTGIEIISPLIFLEATDKVFIQLNYAGSHRPKMPTTMELIATGTQGGTFEVYNQENYIADQLVITCPMSFAEFKQVEARVTEKISADDGKNQVSGWIDNITYNRHTNMAEIILLTAGNPG